MQSLRDTVLLQGEEDAVLGGRGGGTAPLAQGALLGYQRVPTSQAHQAAALLCTGLETGLPRLQGRAGASLAMQRDHPDRRE